MIVLVFDTSIHKGTAGWALFDDSSSSPRLIDYAHTFMPSRPGHAERLLERITLVLDSGGYSISDVGLIAICKGPGTFTGLRIGFATAKALSLSHNIPIVAVSTLEALACSLKQEKTVVSLMDARRKELYMGAYKVQQTDGVFTAQELLTPMVAKPDDVKTVLENHNIRLPAQLAGDGAIVYSEQLKDIGETPHISSTSPGTCFIAETAYRRYIKQGADNPALLEPLYIREPDAKKPKNRPPVDL
jgi:tRNA threonylcarbamoyl adenosine modification protein YeaZ